jgi:hypothetical protein
MLDDMAREEHDREDLLREATALVERIELAPPGDGGGESEHVVIGFRAAGAMSIFFGGETAFHFNSGCELRRAYAGGLLYKAEHGGLVSLERVRRENEVQLMRRSISNEGQAEFLAAIEGQLKKVLDQIRQSGLVTVGQVPAEVDVLSRALEWLERDGPLAVAQSAHVR